MMAYWGDNKAFALAIETLQRWSDLNVQATKIEISNIQEQPTNDRTGSVRLIFEGKTLEMMSYERTGGDDEQA